jgi:hypothetical protein
LCGIGGAVIANVAGFWGLPTAGFCAAFSVVSVAYVSAPKFNNQVAIGVFVLGAIVAWFLLVPSYYPGNYDKSSHAPILATILGGVIALFITTLIELQDRVNKGPFVKKNIVRAEIF